MATDDAVLVVEDEPIIRMMAVDALSSMGVSAYEASDADEALFLLAAHPDIGVLFTDINMPGGMDGIQLARRAHATHPELGIIVTSGQYSICDVAMPEGGRFLSKPYSANQLANAVEQILN